MPLSPPEIGLRAAFTAVGAARSVCETVEHAGLVGTAGIAHDHVEPVGCVDDRDQRDQRTDLVVVNRLNRACITRSSLLVSRTERTPDAGEEISVTARPRDVRHSGLAEV